jgi:hypothetical protein
MAQPINVPRWNTDLTNQTEPPAGQKDTGQVAGAPLDSSYFNWILFTIYEWVLWLQGLQGEILTWTGLNTFNAGIVVTKAAGDAVTATAGTGASAYAVKGTGNTGAGSHGGYFTSTASVSGIGAQGIGTIRGLVGTSTDPDPTSFGVLGIATGAGAGVAGSSDSGAGGSFSSSSGDGVVSVGGANRHGFNGTGTGTGWGGFFTGGGTGAAGVRGVGGANGIGGSFQGTNASGLVATGGTGAGGVVGIGGTGAWGVSAEANGVAALRALRYDSSSLAVFDCRGAIDFENSAAPGITVATKNKLGRDSFPKALAKLTLNGGTPALTFGGNVASVSQAAGGDVSIVFAFNMLSTDYMVMSDIEEALSGDCFVTKVISKSVSGFTLRILQVGNPAVQINQTNSNGHTINFTVFGAQ